jgi:hypothetical protein
LKSLTWLSNDYFAIADVQDDYVKPQNLVIYKAQNGYFFCRLNLKNQIELLRNNTLPNMQTPEVTGIFDWRTHKVYDITMFSLLHLGGRSFNHDPEGRVFEKEQ